MTPTARGSRVALYIRVSTQEQNHEMQEQEMRDYVAFRRWELVEVYADKISGAKDRRPALERLMSDARRGRFDVVAVWRFDRFARSTRHLLQALEEFQALHIDFCSLRESIDTSTPAGKMVFTVLGAVAELELSIRKERCTAGIKRAQRVGTKSGKPFGRPAVAVDVDAIARLRAEGLTWRAVGQRLGISKDTAIRTASASASAN
jgi:DNA invertase Pin-like site-specific DNA recombinase